ncbi:nucleotidyltransferase substrate binding protein [Peptococcaceae bacterium]|nr:nucleotidyltransferase substrate binding protein [Peptococcaceae bacterium]
MRARLEKLIKDFESAYTNLKFACDNAKTDLEVDGAIKRFELYYEVVWKLIKEYLADVGIICKNLRRSCFKEAKKNDLIDNEKDWLDMIEDRNLLVHVYNSANSREIFERIKERYIKQLEKVLKTLKETAEKGY